MPLTSRGFIADPLSPLAWDLFLAALGLAKLAQDVPVDEEEGRAIADIGQVLAPIMDGEHVDPSKLINSRGGPLYDSAQASFAALTTVRNAVKGPLSRLPREAADEMVNVSRYIQAGKSQALEPGVLKGAQESCQILLDLVNSRRPVA